MFDYISVKEAAGKWGIFKRRTYKLCKQNRIEVVLCTDSSGVLSNCHTASVVS